MDAKTLIAYKSAVYTDMQIYKKDLARVNKSLLHRNKHKTHMRTDTDLSGNVPP